MGKIFKNPNPKTPTPTLATISEPVFQMPKATVLPIDQFDKYLSLAETLIQEKKYIESLQVLINLEVTNFNNITVHEYLADIFLQLNQIDLAKEQCQICAQLMKTDITDMFVSVKNFDELLNEIGDIEDLEKEFTEAQKEDLSNTNYHHQINLALKMSTHYFAQKQYKQAESLLINQRAKYMEYIKSL